LDMRRCLNKEKTQVSKDNLVMWQQMYDNLPSPDLSDSKAYLQIRNTVFEKIIQYTKTESHAANKERLKRELGPREFTLTYSPSWYSEDTDAQNAMRCAVERLTKYYKDEIIEFHAVGEFTKDGKSHVHAWYHLRDGHKITDKNFKRAYPHWDARKKLGKGHQGGHHATITRLSDFYGYAEKHLEEAWLNVNINNADDNTPSIGSSDPA